MSPYAPSLEQEMKKFYGTLSEKDKRHYAAIEALKLGQGGIVYISQVLGCDRKTITQGIKEVKALPEPSGYEKRIRKAGGGRKRYDETFPEIDEEFLEVVKDYTAGDPMNAKVLWTNLTPREIADRLAEQHGIRVGVKVIRKLLKKHHYRRRKAQKKQTMKEVSHRAEQFENIARLKAEYEAAGNPILSIDTKRKEYLGNFYREGHLYTLQELTTYDHDFNTFAEGIVIPHGIYDLRQNRGYITLGTSKDTSAFAWDCLRTWGYPRGQYYDPYPTSILA